MTVEFLPNESGTVHLRTHDAPASAPEWMMINPSAEAAKMITWPPGHSLDLSPGQFGYGAEIVNTARQYLAGEIEKATAEQSIAASIARWCKANQGTA